MVKKRQSGFTLIEIMVVVGIVMLLAIATVPNMAGMIRSHRISAAKNLVRAALTQAQGHAAKNQKYAGVRFQFDRDGWELGRQYVVLIESENEPSYTDRFIAVRNAKPVTLPRGIGLLSNNLDINGDSFVDNNDLDTNVRLLNATTFSILFSPTGQLLTKTVNLRRKHDYDSSGNPIEDRIIHYANMVNNGYSLLYCDDEYNGGTLVTPWCVNESSATGLYIYETDAMSELEFDNRYDGYVSTLEPTIINMYTGTIIEER